jgi:catechol 2,3-dioxygenase-like lactoylglutathione lyase family enzyme
VIPKRLSVVTLGVHDLATMRAFYQGLGWTTNSEADDFAAFPLGGAVLCLYEVEKLAGEAAGEAPALDGTRFKGFTLAINVAERDEVDSALATAVKAGARVLAEPVDRDWGGASAYFADPESNAWEIAWLPNSQFDERGALIWPF